MNGYEQNDVSIQMEVLPHAMGLPPPSYATAGSSGVDLIAALKDKLTLDPGKRVLVPTGLIVAIPAGFEWQIRPRSGLALEKGLCILNSPGTIDSDYRGEVRIIVANLGDSPVTIHRGDRIAQAVLSPVVHGRYIAVDAVDKTERGQGGFGHSGIQ